MKLTGRCPYDNEPLLFKHQAVVQPQMPHLAFAGGGPWSQTPDALGQLLKGFAFTADQMQLDFSGAPALVSHGRALARAEQKANKRY
jgi:hypothetical protein